VPYTKVVRCQPGRLNVAGDGRPTLNVADFNRLADDSDALEPNRAGRPLYRPRHNLAMIDAETDKAMRMSTRNMW
jgi:hypothetical protein